MEAGYMELRSKLRLVPAEGQLCPWVQQWGGQAELPRLSVPPTFVLWETMESKPRAAMPGFCFTRNFI